MFIGLLSDTHGLFSSEFRDFLAPVDAIWHAGDFGGGLDTETEIAAFKPLLGVIGNCDDRRLLDRCPLFRFWYAPIVPTSSSAATPTSSKL